MLLLILARVTHHAIYIDGVGTNLELFMNPGTVEFRGLCLWPFLQMHDLIIIIINE